MSEHTGRRKLALVGSSAVLAAVVLACGAAGAAPPDIDEIQAPHTMASTAPTAPCGEVVR